MKLVERKPSLKQFVRRLKPVSRRAGAQAQTVATIVQRGGADAANKFVRGDWSDGVHALSLAAKSVGDAARLAALAAGELPPADIPKAAVKLADMLGKLGMTLPEAREVVAANL